MISLFIDTSNTDVSIAVVKDDEILSSICENIPNQHSVYVVPYVKKVLDDSNIRIDDIDNIMVVNGPGSFTGIRIGLTVAKIMGYSLKKDIIPVSSLKALAFCSKSDYIMALIPARNDNYYIGLYDCYYNDVISEHFGNIDEVNELINKYENVSVVSCEDITIGEVNINKSNLDILKIVNYYKDEEAIDAHVIKSNYLKLPQAVSDRNG